MTHQTNRAHDRRIVVTARRPLRSRAAAAVIVPIAVAALAVAATPALAQNGLEPSRCSDLSLEFFGLEFRTAGQLVSYVAQEFGNDGTHNPGNAHNPFPPFVPFVLECNPTATQG